jgi:hypothetical protein
MGRTRGAVVWSTIAFASLGLMALTWSPPKSLEPSFYPIDFGLRYVAVAPFHQTTTRVDNATRRSQNRVKRDSSCDRSASFVAAISIAAVPFFCVLATTPAIRAPWAYVAR